jgi:hypothetical protein
MSELAEIMSRLPKGSKASQEAVAAEMAAREAAEKAAYAAHTLPSEIGKKAIAKAKETLMTPEQKAKLEAELREKGKQKFLEPSKVKERLYHGTGKDITEFDKSKIKRPYFGEGFHLAESPSLASFYAKQWKEDQNVMPIYAQIKNPYELKDMSKWYDLPGETDAEKTSFLKAQGFDGIKYHHGAPYDAPEESGIGYVAFEPNQIKSATGNRGTYDIEEKDITKAEGGAIDAPDWHTQLGQMLKNPEPTWYDQLGEMMMAEGGSVKMAEGGQTFPLKDPEEEQRRRMMEGSDIRIPQKYPTLVKVGEGIRGAHEFISKPFGYENPPGEFVSELLGIPAVGKTLEDIGYGMPLTTGAGMTSNVRPEVAEAALTALPIAGKAAQMTAKAAPKVAKKATEALAPTVADLLETQLQKSGMMMGAAPEGKLSKEEYSRMMREKYAAENAAKMAKKETAPAAEEIKAPADDLGFYSNVEKAALNLQRKSGTGDELIADLLKNPGVSEARLEELGLTALKGKKNVTADEVRELAARNKPQLSESVRAEKNYDDIERLESEYEDLSKNLHDLQGSGNRGAIASAEAELQENIMQQKRLKAIPEAKFSPSELPQYNMPGGENYREIRVKLNPKRLSEEEARVVLNAKPNARLTETDIRFASRKNKDEFMHTAHHGNEPDVLFHLRVADHTDAEGKKGLLIDELQSDWHQAGREKGYKGAANKLPEGWTVDEAPGLNGTWVVRDQDGKLINQGSSKEDALEFALKKQSGVPDAPFKENWYQLGLKRAIKEATDTGMDRVYLTTGKTQNERYDLSKQISYLSIDQKPNGMVRINASKDGEPVILKDVPKDQLADYIGKDMAKKAIEDIEAGKNAIYSGLDLQVGGEGMKQYYDKNYLNWLKKYAKEHGAAVGETKLAGSDEMVYYLDLNPKLKNTAKKGQSYKRGGTIKHHKYSRELQKYAEGGTISEYNTSPDRSDGGLMILEKNGYA